MDLLSETGQHTEVLAFGIGSLFKIVFFFLFLLYIGYSFFLALRVKILVNTVRTPWNNFLRRLAFLHFYAVIGIGALAMFLIMIA